MIFIFKSSSILRKKCVCYFSGFKHLLFLMLGMETMSVPILCTFLSWISQLKRKISNTNISNCIISNAKLPLQITLAVEHSFLRPLLTRLVSIAPWSTCWVLSLSRKENNLWSLSTFDQSQKLPWGNVCHYPASHRFLLSVQKNMTRAKNKMSQGRSITLARNWWHEVKSYILRR